MEIPGCIVETKRLSLRPFVAADALQLHTILADPQVVLSTNPRFVPSLEQVEAFIEGSRRQWEREDFGQWLIVKLDEPKSAIGYCGFKRWELDMSRLELLFGLAPAFWGKGFATEAAGAALAYRARKFPELTVMAAAFHDNRVPCVACLPSWIHCSPPPHLFLGSSLLLAGSSYPSGTGRAAILSTIAPNSRRVRWLSVNSSQ